MAFKMKYKKGGFPFKNDDDKNKVVNNEEKEIDNQEVEKDLEGTRVEYRPQSTYSGEGKKPKPGDHDYIPDE